MKIFNQLFLLTACCTVLLAACNKADNPSPTQAQAAGAAANVSDADISAARAAEGAHTIHNELTVKQ